MDPWESRKSHHIGEVLPESEKMKKTSTESLSMFVLDYDSGKQ